MPQVRLMTLATRCDTSEQANPWQAHRALPAFAVGTVWTTVGRHRAVPGCRPPRRVFRRRAILRHLRGSPAGAWGRGRMCGLDVQAHLGDDMRAQLMCDRVCMCVREGVAQMGVRIGCRSLGSSMAGPKRGQSECAQKQAFGARVRTLFGVCSASALTARPISELARSAGLGGSLRKKGAPSKIRAPNADIGATSPASPTSGRP